MVGVGALRRPDPQRGVPTKNGRAEDCPPYQTAKKKRPRSFRGRSQFRLGKRLYSYGLVVVVVVVSSCLITAGAWGRANTTFRTTTRSPTVE